MVRQRLYHTTEQKVAANRAKSKRSYDKQKDIINKRRRKKYSREQKMLTRARNELETLREGKSTFPQRQPVDVWLERTDRIAARLQKITGDDARRYLHGIVKGFVGNQDKDAVYKQIVAVGKLQKSVYGYENEVLTLAGLGPEYEKVREVARTVCDVIKWLEEVLCIAMVDAVEVEIKYKECRFSFQ